MWRATQSAAELIEQRKEKAALSDEITRAKLLQTASASSWCNELECVFDVPTANIETAKKGRSWIVFKKTSASK